MKQKILLIIIISFLTKGYSQENKIEFQLSLGPTFSMPKTSKLSNTSFGGSPEVKSSINIGAYILSNTNYSFSEKSSLDFGIGFYLDRFSIEDKMGAISTKGNRNISQIQVPINYNIHFSKDKSFQFGIGGFTSFLISAKEIGNIKTDFSQIDMFSPEKIFQVNLDESYDSNIKDNYNSIAFGVFIQLKKNILFSTHTKGFLILKINQYLNSIKNIESNSGLISYIEIKNEKEPTTINLGFGIVF